MRCTRVTSEDGKRTRRGLAMQFGEFWTQLECAGINRREVANARVVQVRRSEPTWPRVMRGQSRGCT